MISAVLMTERDTDHTPVYFVSRALQAPELNYNPMEKLVLALVCAAKRLCRYFQAHPIVVITDQPIKMISAVLMTERDTDHTPVYFPKGCADTFRRIPSWSSPTSPSSVALILTSPEGTEFTYALRFQFTTSNNEAEYEALTAGLRISAHMGVCNVYVSVDSKLVANQVLGSYVAKEENMVTYLEKAKILISGFANFSISQVPRSKNKKVDALSKIASTSFAHLSNLGRNGTLPGNRKEASKLRIKARQYELLEGVLYGRSFLKPWLRCVGPLQADYVIRKGQVFYSRHGLFHKVDIRESRSNNHRQSGEEIRVGQHSMPFRSPRRIVSNNVKHLKSNGLLKRANQSLCEGIKARLGEGNKNWIKELSHVLWDHRTMIKSSHGDTPFSLNYGTEAVIPAEIRMPTYRTAVVDAIQNNEELQLNLDLLEEHRECAAIREAKAKLKMTKYYNTRVHSVTFRPEDFVYRGNETSHAMDGGKLGPKWEGPYEVTEALRDGAYRIRSMDETVLSQT
nr:hypothetical protein [Tanacetum cinerariifolium]